MLLTRDAQAKPTEIFVDEVVTGHLLGGTSNDLYGSERLASCQARLNVVGRQLACRCTGSSSASRLSRPSNGPGGATAHCGRSISKRSRV
jgi:hypothetical protein